MKSDQKYLSQLSLQFPNIHAAAAEIINLSSVLNLPKGTEHFISDIHGEYASFQHVLRNASGSIAKKIEDEFGDELSDSEKRTLATLIYYPHEKLDLIEETSSRFDEWCRRALFLLIRVTRRTAFKYNRTKLKRALKPDYEYIIEELLTERAEVSDKEAYYNGIIDAIIQTNSAKSFIIVFCRLIQHLAIDRLHILGDIFDRGAKPHLVMDRLETYHSVDIQWGNHDIEWMGAACGSVLCMASVIRFSIKYGNLDTLEEGYGINLIPLMTFAMTEYKNDPCERFGVEKSEEDEDATLRKMHKAIAVLQLKLEGQLARRRPEFEMEKRAFLDKIDYEKGTVTIEGKVYPLTDAYFPTVNPSDPYALSEGEKKLCEKIYSAFRSNEKLQRHADFLYARGSMFRIYNGNLLYHGCIPLNRDGSFMSATIGGQTVSGKALCETLELWARKARYSRKKEEKEYGLDVMYFIWSNERSPLYGKDKMTTFERYFLDDSSVKTEVKNPYYALIEDERVVRHIFEEFGIDFETGHIINGHMPVRRTKGESPVHLGGKVIIIDGGFSAPYQKVTGIAGYTLVSDSRLLKIIAHEPFVSTEEAIRTEKDMRSAVEIIAHANGRLRVADTDRGREMQERIQDLNELIVAYKSGTIREHQM
ncbi:MAG: fructose-1,6-bisphosphatase [Clostridia bacterium]|nr:fructose-1,6-bisphosphatase [Clostridia bacterium]